MTTMTETRTGLPAGISRLDTKHSQVGFAVDYMGGTFRGTFAPAEATLEVAEDGSARLEGRLRAADVKVQDETMSAHLQSPEFFDVERTPELRFVSTDVRRNGHELSIAGELTIKGTSRPIELRGRIGDPIADPFGGERFAVTLGGAVDRTEFGLEWNTPLPTGEPALANEVALSGELSFTRA